MSAEVGPMITQADVVLMPMEVSEEEQAKAALNILDHMPMNSREALYHYLLVLACLGLTDEHFFPDEMSGVGLAHYMGLW